MSVKKYNLLYQVLINFRSILMMFLGTTDFRLQAVTVVEAGRRDIYPGRRLVLKRTPCLLSVENQGLDLPRFNTWFFIVESFALIPTHGTILTILTKILHISLVQGVDINMGVGTQS